MASALGRLKTRSEFLRVAAGRCKWATPGVVVQAWRRPHEARKRERDAVPPGAIRVGYTASRKVGAAVARNRARRRLRAACSEVMPVMGQAGYDYVLIARGETLRRPYAELVEDLRTALARLAACQARKRDGKSKAAAGRSRR